MNYLIFFALVIGTLISTNMHADPCLPGDKVTSISEIQGITDSSPLTGQRVIIQGHIIANMQDRSKLKGIYIAEQPERSHLNPDSSSGIFMYLPANHSYSPKKFTLKPGQSIQITGRVKEHYGLTELTQISEIRLCASDNQRPNIKILNSIDTRTLESAEGMLVRINQPWISGNKDLGRYGEVQLSIGDPLSTGKRIKQETLVLSMGEKPSIRPLFPHSTDARIGTKLKPITGIIHFGYGKYWLIPTLPVEIEDAFRPEKPYQPEHYRLSLVHLNIKNLFNGTGDGKGFPTKRGARTFTEYQFQLAKLALNFNEINANIIALSELENDGYGSESAIADLVDAINSNRENNHYKYARLSQKDANQSTDAITQGVLYQTDFIDINEVKFLSLQSSNYPARPALLVKGEIKNSRQKFQIAVIHLKSRARPCSEDIAPKKDAEPTEGNCHQRRENQMKTLLDQLQPSPGIDLIIGDFNAYPKERPLVMAKQKGWMRTEELEHQMNGIPLRIDYTYVFNDQPVILDHMLLHQRDQHLFLKRFDWHINAAEASRVTKEEQISNRISRYRSSDHDPNVLYLK